MKHAIPSFSALVALWPPADLAADLGVKPGLPAVWKHRDSVPPEHWRGVVDSARRRRIAGITLELLADLAAAKSKAASAHEGKAA